MSSHTSGQRPYRRQHIIVNRPLQFKFVGVMVGFLASALAIALLGICAVLWATLSTFGLLNDPVAVSLFVMAGWVLALELLLLAPLIIWVGILLTHKVAGPLVRIHAALAQMAQGNFDIHLTLRKEDALHELCGLINRLAASLRNRPK